MRRKFILKAALVAITYITVCLSQDHIHAQIRVDSTTSSRTVLQGSTTKISGGIETNSFLFHQFIEFNALKNSSVIFLNPKSKDTVISRVVGNSYSSISGAIGVEGKANLIFINPNGISFLNGASIDIDGSFLASTANSMIFQKNRLVLKHSDNQSQINVEGSGHNLIFSGNSRIPNFFNSPQSKGLETSPNNSLSFIANQINFDGGIATAPSGTVNLIAIKNGKAVLSSSLQGLEVESQVNNFGNITLQNRAFVNASGSRQGSIYVKANDLSITDAALIYVENLGSRNLGVIDVDASNLLIDGITATTPLFPFTFDAYSRGISSVSNTGAGPEIKVSADTLTFLNQGAITSNAEGISDGANISIDVKELIKIEGATPLNPFLPFGSFIGTVSRGSGKAGNIKLSSRDLVINNGGNLQSVVLNTGKGGDINIDVENDIALSGFTPFSNIPSIISTISVGNLTNEKSGDGGRLKIRSKRLLLKDGARIDASTLADGNSGSVDIEAESIVIRGKIPNDESSQIISSSNTVNQFLKSGFNLNQPTGNSGSVSIRAKILRISDSGSVNVRSDGTGDAGVVKINADEVNISNQGNISASTNGGTGGNIVVDADLLTLTDGTISSNAKGIGEGGNISIKSIFTALNQGSTVEANAENAQAGRIEIETNTLSTNRDASVTTTSQLGPQFDGTVQAIVENSQAIKPVSLISAAEPISTLSQICGYSGNSVSQQDKASEDEIVTDPTLIKAFALKQRHESTKNLLYRHQDTGEVEQIKPLLAVEQVSNGKVKFIHDPNESNNVSNLLSFLERKCQSYHKS